MTALPSSGAFTQVDPTHVAALGPATAILYARIEWRARETGSWRATRSQMADETGLSQETIRTAVTKLRALEWVTAERASVLDATLVWSPLFPVVEHVVNSPISGWGNSPHLEMGNSTISSLETDKTKETPRTLRVVVPEDKPEPRPEVVRLCEQLADRIESNGSKRPTIGKGWLDACRLLIDRDGRTPEQISRAIDWCQADDFWRVNVLSMPTLRRQYDRLRLKAQRDQAAASQGRRPDNAWLTTPSEPVLPPPPRQDLYG